MSYQVRLPCLPKASLVIFSPFACSRCCFPYCLSTIFMSIHCLHTTWVSCSCRMETHAWSCRSDHFHSSLFAAEEKANTRLLLGMSLDSYARYLLNINQLPVAQKMYEKALQISNDVQGETHPQVTCTNCSWTTRERKANLLGNEVALKAALPAWNIHGTKLGSVFQPGRMSTLIYKTLS